MNNSTQDRAALAKRFNRIRQHYGNNMAAIMADGAEWFDDAYSWEHEAGVVLTPIERALWHDIRAESAVLYPQFPVGRYFVDFGNPVAMVAIECDGERWHLDAERDRRRQQDIEAMGWTVYRITGRDCFSDFTEDEDERGVPVIKAGAARKLIREVCDRHGIRRHHGKPASSNFLQWSNLL